MLQLRVETFFRPLFELVVCIILTVWRRYIARAQFDSRVSLVGGCGRNSYPHAREFAISFQHGKVHGVQLDAITGEPGHLGQQYPRILQWTNVPWPWIKGRPHGRHTRGKKPINKISF